MSSIALAGCFSLKGETGCRCCTEGASLSPSLKTLFFLSFILYKHQNQRHFTLLSVHAPFAFPVKWRTGGRWCTEGAFVSPSLKTLFITCFCYKHQNQRHITVLSVHKPVDFPLKGGSDCRRYTDGASFFLSLLFFFFSPFLSLFGSIFRSPKKQQKPLN